METGAFLAVAFILLSGEWPGAGASYHLTDDALCPQGQLPCDSGQCIQRKQWCDNEANCDDGSDEEYCQNTNISGNDDSSRCQKTLHFQCNDGVCIPKDGRCDDLPDCRGQEDEENCDYLYQANDETKSESVTTTISTTTRATKPNTWIPTRVEVLRKSVQHVIESRDVKWGWGKATPQVVTALCLANSSYFDLDNQDGLMTKKQLEVQLALDLMKNDARPLSLHELVHYIHALLSACQNPKNFHGVNVVRLLKKKMAERQAKGLFVSPAAYLALCNAGDFSDIYLKKLKNMAYRRSEEQRWLDIQSYALMTIACRTLSNQSNAKEWLLLKEDVAKNLTEWQQLDGSFGNVYSTGLALQALIASEEPGTESSKGRALTYLLMRQDWQGSFGHEVDNYYVLPALNVKSLAHVHTRKCQPNPYSTQSTEGVRHSGRKKQAIVHYSLWLGGDRNEIHTVTLAVSRHSNFIEVMEVAENANPRYKFQLLTTARGSTVNSIAGRPNNVAKSTYWTLYRRVPLPFKPNLSNTTATASRLKLFGAKRWAKDLQKLYPKDGEHLAFWYKPYL